jgi:integrase
LLCAIDCTSSDEAVRDYVQASVSPATVRAYQADLHHFMAWGGAIPSTDAQVATYIAAHARTLAAATLTRRLASIAQAHSILRLPSPTTSALVRATMRGIRRTNGTAQRQASPLLRDDLFLVLDRLGDDVRAARDRALLLIGFAGGFRRSEIVGLNVEDIESVRQGLIISLRHSKTDQEGHGRKIGIPLGRTHWCPVAALTQWLDVSGVTSGPIFRPVDRHGLVGAARLSGEAVCIIVRERVASAGIDPAGYSGHSLRSGFATSAAQAGVSTLKIRAQTGHASDVILARYIRDGELFSGNAAGLLL